MSTTNTTHNTSTTAWLGELAAELTGEQLDSLVWQRREMSFPEATADDLRTTDECLIGDAKRTVEENRVLAWVEQQPRPAAPAWHQGAYPTVQMFTKAGEPVRTFERAFDTKEDGWSCYLFCEEVLTVHGVERGPVQIVAGTPTDGATPAQARAMAAALVDAAEAAVAGLR